MKRCDLLQVAFADSTAIARDTTLRLPAVYPQAAGVAIAEQLYTAGARRGYCINDDISNVAKGVRCTNFNTKFTALGGTTVRPACSHRCYACVRVL
jgi:hypothetical protein